MDNLASKILLLLTTAERVLKSKQQSVTDAGAGSSFLTFTNREKVLLLLLEKPLKPFQLLDTLCIDKTNLSHITSKLVDCGYITKTKSTANRRLIEFSITEMGKDYINSVLKNFETKIQSLQADKNEYESLVTAADKLINIISFL